MRIRIVSAIKYCILLAFCIWFYLFHRHEATLLLLVSVFLFPALSLLGLFLCSSRLRKEISFSSQELLRRQQAALCFRLHNSGCYYFSRIELTFTLENQLYPNPEKHSLTSFAFPFSQREEELVFQPESCGTQKAVLTECRLWDIFGLCYLTVPCQLEATTTVLPSLMTSLPIPDSFTISKEEDQVLEADYKGEDHSEVREIRAYRPGDRMQDIHWKLSAARDALFVKEYSSQRNHSFSLAIDFRILTSKENDYYFDVLYTMLYRFMKAHLDFAVCLPGNAPGELSFQSITSSAELHAFFTTFFADYASQPDLLLPALNDLSQQPVLILSSRSQLRGFGPVHSFESGVRLFQPL